MNINEYREQFAAYKASLAVARFNYYIGSEPAFRIAQLRSDYSDLFSFGALKNLQSHIEESPAVAETERSALRGLLASARLEHLEIRASEVSAELAICESSTQLEWRGETFPCSTISSRLGIESDKARRDELVYRWTDAVSTCDNLRFSRLQLLHEATGELGFSAYRDLIAEATRTNLNQVELDASTLLERTESLNRLAYSTLATRGPAAQSTGSLNFADLAYLERLPWRENFFSTHKWSQIYPEIMIGLGIRVDKQPNVRIAYTDRLLPRPADCFAVKPPADVWLVCSQRRGAAELVAGLHAAGLAQQYAWCSADLAEKYPEFIYSPDPATREGYGYLFRMLMLDPDWIRQSLRPTTPSQASEVARDMASLLALQVRRLAAETSFALLLHGATHPSLEQLQSAFADLHERATVFHLSPKLFLLNLHERIDSAGRLRALAFAAGLRDYLRVRHGNHWWETRKAGDELIDLWNTASRYPVEELARLIGFGELSFDSIIELLGETMNGA